MLKLVCAVWLNKLRAIVNEWKVYKKLRTRNIITMWWSVRLDSFVDVAVGWMRVCVLFFPSFELLSCISGFRVSFRLNSIHSILAFVKSCAQLSLLCCLHGLLQRSVHLIKWHQVQNTQMNSFRWFVGALISLWLCCRCCYAELLMDWNDKVTNTPAHICLVRYTQLNWSTVIRWGSCLSLSLSVVVIVIVVVVIVIAIHALPLDLFHFILYYIFMGIYLC